MKTRLLMNSLRRLNASSLNFYSVTLTPRGKYELNLVYEHSTAKQLLLCTNGPRRIVDFIDELYNQELNPDVVQYLDRANNHVDNNEKGSSK
jgi:hypothetical protein